MSGTVLRLEVEATRSAGSRSNFSRLERAAQGGLSIDLVTATRESDYEVTKVSLVDGTDLFGEPDYLVRVPVLCQENHAGASELFAVSLAHA